MAGYSPFILVFSFFFVFSFTFGGEQHDSLDLLRPAIGFGEEKTSQLHFNFHDKVGGHNPTAVQVASAPSNKSPLGFGTVMVMDDPLTEGPEPTSNPVGRAQGLHVSASQETMALLMAMNFAFLDGKYNGSSLTVLGRNTLLSDVREMPVVGGSGLFRFARWYALAHTHQFDAETAIVEYNVYVVDFF